MSAVLGYFKTLGIAIDILINAILGGNAYMTVSGQIGQSIRDGGWASKVPWPSWLHDHFLQSVFEETV